MAQPCGINQSKYHVTAVLIMTRMSAVHRRQMIRRNAAVVASEIGLANLTFNNVADACPVQTSPSTVRHYFTYLSELQLAAIHVDPDLRPQAVAMGLITK